MSFDFRLVRQPSNDPVLKYITNLQKQMVKFLTKDQIKELEGSEDIFGDIQDVNSGVKFQTDLNSTISTLFNNDAYAPMEPDKDKLRIWLQGRSMINIRDLSEDFTGGDITVRNDAVLVDGDPFDYGLYHGSTLKSRALRFNRPTSVTENDEYITIPHTARTRASEALSAGISFFIRFRVFSLSTQNGYPITLYEKTDNNPITDGVEITIGSDGKLAFRVENTNVTYTKETASGTISTNTVYDVWCTYTKSGNVQHIYVNNVDETLTTGGATLFHPDTTNLDATIFSVGAGIAAGCVHGDLYDFKIYREKIVSPTEVGYHWTNKLSISNIPFAQVIVGNYWGPRNETLQIAACSFTNSSFAVSFSICGAPPVLASYTSTSYTDTSYGA